MRQTVFAVAVSCLLVLGPTPIAGQSSDEDVARRQLESGRSFARQGNHAEALKDFKAVVEAHGTTSVADDALLAMSEYYLDVLGDRELAADAVDTLLRKYPVSNAAPAAYVIVGRLALARSHQAADVTTALANFDRVTRLFPDSPAVPASLLLGAEALSYVGRLDEALGNLARIAMEYRDSPVAPKAQLVAGQILTMRGDAIAAMQELQQVRDNWPASPEAEEALGRLTILHRLYVRPRTTVAALALGSDRVGPAKLDKVTAMATTAGHIYWLNESGVGTASTAAPRLQTLRPRGLALDNAHAVWAIETGALRPLRGAPLYLRRPRPKSEPESVDRIAAAAQLSNGDWLVADDDERSVYRFNRGGEYQGRFATGKVARLAVDAMDHVAAVDRDQRGVTVFDETGRVTGRLAAKAQNYDIENAEDLAFDVFGHLYVLDRSSVVVFTPYGPAASPTGGSGPATGVTPGSGSGAVTAGGTVTPARQPVTYRPLAVFDAPDKSPAAFRRASSFTLDRAGAIYLYEGRDERIRVYR